MQKETYAIFADAAADIPAEFAREHEIRLIPMNYTLSKEDRLCTQIESPDVLKRFYDGQRGGDLTRTAQVAPQRYLDMLEPVLKSGRSVLYLSLSSGLSGTYESSLIAASQLMQDVPDQKVVCVDTRTASVGIGYLLECAVHNRAEGMTIDENAAWLEQNRLRLRHWFAVDDLMYLKRGGRISSATAAIGSALNVKPVLKIKKDGTLVSFAKKHGEKAALEFLAQQYAAHAAEAADDRVLIVHADNPDAAAALEKMLRAVKPACRVTAMMLSPLIGAHVGPGMCALVHMGPEGSERD